MNEHDTPPEDHRRRIDIVTDPSFSANLADVPTDEIRERRTLCAELDTEYSFYRRLLHGRMDLLEFEMRRRSGEETRSLIEALPEILAGTEMAMPMSTIGRAVPVVVPDLPEHGRRTIDRVLDDDFLARLPDIEDDELTEIQRMLTDVEHDVSERRRVVYEVYERLQAELTRRYRDGLANIDELLQGS